MEEVRLVFSILRVLIFMGVMIYFIQFQRYIPKKDHSLYYITGAFAVLTIGSFVSIGGNYPILLEITRIDLPTELLISFANITYMGGTILVVIGLIFWSKSVIAFHSASDEAKGFRAQLIEQNELLRERTRDLEIRTVDYFEQREAALESEQSKVNFLRNTSHELRTPLNAIIGLSELLANYSIENEVERKEFAKMILDSGRKLLNTIDTILEIARINSNEYLPSLLTGDIHTVLSECITQCLPKAHSKSITISAPPKDSPTAHATFDRKALHHILVNILDNALTYSPIESTVFISIDLSEDEFMTIVIRDQGPGIPEEFMQTIFEIFGRAEHWQNRGEGNAGFGLALAYKMVQIQHGKLRLESDGKCGTTVYVSLPLSPQPIPAS